MKPQGSYLTGDDIRYQFRVMVRWCRMFHKTDVDWVALEAARFRARHPLLPVELPERRAA